jgi:hypothetical protein
MTLDITQISAQIGEMVAGIKIDSRERSEHLRAAMSKLTDPDLNLEKLKRKIAAARTPSWSPAGLVEGFGQKYPAPETPREYSALATDGSDIAVDRNMSANCYLINIGSVYLHYGNQPYADLRSASKLYFKESDLVIKDPNNTRHEQMIEGALLDAKRAVEECRKLADLASTLPSDETLLALMDGSLVLFGMQNFQNHDYIMNEIVDQGFLAALNTLRELSLSRRLCLASYISFPRSDNVINALRVAICPQEHVDCDVSCQMGESACDALSGVNDRMLFNEWLKIGERSALFMNSAEIVKKRYGRENQVYFFYLRVEDEIARVEIPGWIALRPDLLALTHALVLDQCRRGQGYPIALSESHEQAVVTGSDRELFWGLVDEALVEKKLPDQISTKSRSKRTRWV